MIQYFPSLSFWSCSPTTKTSKATPAETRLEPFAKSGASSRRQNVFLQSFFWKRLALSALRLAQAMVLLEGPLLVPATRAESSKLGLQFYESLSPKATLRLLQLCRGYGGKRSGCFDSESPLLLLAIGWPPREKRVPFIFLL